jgi:hypothetical protein
MRGKQRNGKPLRAHRSANTTFSYFMGSCLAVQCCKIRFEERCSRAAVRSVGLCSRFLGTMPKTLAGFNHTSRMSFKWPTKSWSRFCVAKAGQSSRQHNVEHIVGQETYLPLSGELQSRRLNPVGFVVSGRGGSAEASLKPSKHHD